MKKYQFKRRFASGADVSWLPMMEATGFPFRNRDGKPQDCLATLKEYGLNALRLRVWMNPSSHPHHGHCSLPETLTLAKRARGMGFDVMVNLHYADSWRDPNFQGKPDVWADLPFDRLCAAMNDYTKETIRAFVAAGVVPEWVQIGNETNPGFLMPDGSADRPEQLARLYTAGHDAVKAVSPRSRTIIHLAEGNKTDFLIRYFDRLAEYGCRYDMIGVSYYPWWLKVKNDEIIDDLGKTLLSLPERYDKDIMVVETGEEDDKEQACYDLLLSVIRKCAQAPRCRGMFYWEPEGARAWSNYNLSAWRDDGTPSAGMNAYLSIQQPKE